MSSDPVWTAVIGGVLLPWPVFILQLLGIEVGGEAPVVADVVEVDSNTTSS